LFELTAYVSYKQTSNMSRSTIQQNQKKKVIFLENNKGDYSAKYRHKTNPVR
jgi:hypothetical protein